MDAPDFCDIKRKSISVSGQVYASLPDKEGGPVEVPLPSKRGRASINNLNFRSLHDIEYRDYIVAVNFGRGMRSRRLQIVVR